MKEAFICALALAVLATGAHGQPAPPLSLSRDSAQRAAVEHSWTQPWGSCGRYYWAEPGNPSPVFLGESHNPPGFTSPAPLDCRYYVVLPNGSIIEERR